MNLNCRDASKLLSAAEERALTRYERLGLRIHLLLCGVCRRFEKQLQLLRQALAAAPTDVLVNLSATGARLSPERGAQIKQLLNDQTRDG